MTDHSHGPEHYREKRVLEGEAGLITKHSRIPPEYREALNALGEPFVRVGKDMYAMARAARNIRERQRELAAATSDRERKQLEDRLARSQREHDAAERRVTVGKQKLIEDAERIIKEGSLPAAYEAAVAATPCPASLEADALFARELDEADVHPDRLAARAGTGKRMPPKDAGLITHHLIIPNTCKPSAEALAEPFVLLGDAIFARASTVRKIARLESELRTIGRRDQEHERQNLIGRIAKSRDKLRRLEKEVDRRKLAVDRRHWPSSRTGPASRTPDPVIRDAAAGRSESGQGLQSVQAPAKRPILTLGYRKPAAVVSHAHDHRFHIHPRRALAS
jgi:hypothetical protein